MNSNSTVTGPASLTSQRCARKRLIQEHKYLWDELLTEFGVRLNENVKKQRHSKSFVLEAVCGKGKKKTKRVQSCKFKLTYKTKSEALQVQSQVHFGDALLTHLQYRRKRYRGCCEGERDHNLRSAATKRTKLDSTTNLAHRLCARASSNGVEREMFEATAGYTDFRCVGTQSISNFIRSLKRSKQRKQKREFSDIKYKDYANYLRQGLQAGTYENFICPLDDDEDDDVASWRRHRKSHQPRPDHSAYDLHRVQKQMLGLALYYESMLVTGRRKTDRFATQEDALIFAASAIDVSSRTLRTWRNDFQTNNKRFTER